MNILDEEVREVLAIEVDTSLPAERVIRVLEQVTAWRGQPQAIWLDNDPEFLADRFMTWCTDRGIALGFIQSSKPNENAFVERFNSDLPPRGTRRLCVRVARSGARDQCGVDAGVQRRAAS